MNPKEEYYALALVAAGKPKVVHTKDRFQIVSDKLATYSTATDSFALTDKGKDRLARKGA